MIQKDISFGPIGIVYKISEPIIIIHIFIFAVFFFGGGVLWGAYMTPDYTF